MILTLDIGNTNIKAGYFLENHLIEFVTFKNEEEFSNSINKEELNGIAISSVVPGLSEKVKNFLKEKFGLNPYIISKDSQFNLKLDYKIPETLGIDRICSLEGALNSFNQNKILKEDTYVLTIDFGTATTINIAASPCNFIGGLISPGIKTMFSSLKNKTAQLPELNISNYKSLIGEDTKSSIASGIIASTVGMIEKTLTHLKENCGAKVVKYFITGGNAKQVQPFLPDDFIYDESLVLKGVNVIYNLNKTN